MRRKSHLGQGGRQSQHLLPLLEVQSTQQRSPASLLGVLSPSPPTLLPALRVPALLPVAILPHRLLDSRLTSISACPVTSPVNKSVCDAPGAPTTGGAVVVALPDAAHRADELAKERARMGATATARVGAAARKLGRRGRRRGMLGCFCTGVVGVRESNWGAASARRAQYRGRRCAGEDARHDLADGYDGPSLWGEVLWCTCTVTNRVLMPEECWTPATELRGLFELASELHWQPLSSSAPPSRFMDTCLLYCSSESTRIGSRPAEGPV